MILVLGERDCLRAVVDCVLVGVSGRSDGALTVGALAAGAGVGGVGSVEVGWLCGG